MSKYLELYDILIKKLGIVELIYLYQIPDVRKFHLKENEFIIGKYVKYEIWKYSYKIFKKQILYKSNKYDYEKLSDIERINHIKSKYIINYKGEIYTTLTKYFALQKYKINRDIVLKDKNLLRGDIKWILLITFLMRKNRFIIPRNIIYLILIKICRLHIIDNNKYTCKNCYEFLNKDKLCIECDEVCDLCEKSTKDTIRECIICGRFICDNCQGLGYCQSMACKCHLCFSYKCKNCGFELKKKDKNGNIKMYCEYKCKTCGEYIE